VSQNDANTNYSELISNCDLLIKAGKISAATELISGLNLAQVPRSSRQALAKICRRVDLFGHGLRLLQPLIRQEKKNFEPATAGEICEYSVLLSRIGLRQEAMNLLKTVDASVVPEALLYLAYCHVFDWDYDQAVEPLEKFLASGADSYSKLIARVNLISSYIATTQFAKAAELLIVTIELAEQASATRLVGNCLELRGRLQLQQGNFAESRADLNRALEIFHSAQSYDRLFVDKWQSVMTALEQRSTEPLLHFRKEAFLRKEWDSVREADMFTLKVQFNQNLFDHLNFGTPMSGYRRRIQNEVGGQVSASYLLGQEGSNCLDLQTGHLDHAEDFSPGKKIHCVLSALVKDFYVPRSIGALFSELYPDDYFDINSSPRRVRQLILRTRQWLKESKIPARIEQSGGGYQFSIYGSFSICIPFGNHSLGSNSVHWQQLKNRFPAGVPFSARQACHILNWPRSSFLVVAEWALKAGELKKSGKGRTVLYQIAVSSQNQTDPAVA
jgi:tetratricopeptide (TPR) repeat protein